MKCYHRHDVGASADISPWRGLVITPSAQQQPEASRPTGRESPALFFFGLLKISKEN